MTEEQAIALILEKLEERNRMLDDANAAARELLASTQQVAATMSMLAGSAGQNDSGKPATTTLTPFSTSSSSSSAEKNSGTVPITTEDSELEDTISTNSKRMATYPVALKTSPTSAPPHDAIPAISIATTGHPLVMPTSYSTLGPYLAAHVPASAAMFSASPMASSAVMRDFSASAPSRDAVLAVFMDSSLNASASHTKCSAPGVIMGTQTLAPMITLAIAQIVTMSTPKLGSIGIIHAPSDGSTNACDTCQLFEVLSHAPFALLLDDSKFEGMLHHNLPAIGNSCRNLSNSGNANQGGKVPKPPWLVGTEVSSSWFEKSQLVSGFMLEASPWCTEHVMCVQLQTPWLSPTQSQYVRVLFLVMSPWPLSEYLENVAPVLGASSEVHGKFEMLPAPNFDLLRLVWLPIILLEIQDALQFSEVDGFVELKIPWLPSEQIKIAAKGVSLRPMPWPSLFGCHAQAQCVQESLLPEFVFFKNKVQLFVMWLHINVMVLILSLKLTPWPGSRACTAEHSCWPYPYDALCKIFSGKAPGSTAHEVAGDARMIDTRIDEAKHGISLYYEMIDELHKSYKGEKNGNEWMSAKLILLFW